MIKRKIFNSLINHLSKKEITFLIGPRQCGKTTLLLMLKKYLEQDNKKTIYFNLDIEMDKQHFTSQMSLFNKIELEFGNNKGFVFIDEIQRKEDAGIFLKGLYDMNLPYKFIVTGSGSVELKEKLHESLAGRKRIFELSTITFEEFLNYKTEYKYENNLTKFCEIESVRLEKLLDEYLNFGGYPRIIIEKELSEKILLMNEIFTSYIEKDILYLLNVKKTETFFKLVKILASQTGQIINYSEISNTLGISFTTLKNYLWYLEKTFIIQKLTPFYRNVRKEITKTPIYYFYDIGLKNFATDSFGSLTNEKEKSFLFQNFIFNILKEKIANTGAKLHFWRTKDKAEVDFVIDRGKEVIPIEVKFQNLKTCKVGKSLFNFLKRYRPQKAFIVNLKLDKSIKFENTEIVFLPYFKLIDGDFS